MSTPIGVLIILGLGYMDGSILWPRFYYQRLDPVLRRWLADRLGVRIVRRLRPGGLHRGLLWFGPLYHTIASDQQGTMLQEVVVL